MAITVAYVASMATSLGLVRSRLLVGAGRADHHHAARALAGDEGHRPGPGRARRAGRAAPRRRRAGRPDDGAVETVPARPTCAPGDVVLVRSGGRVPADGEIVDGAAELDESMITGESRPVAKDRGRPGRGRHRRHRLGDPGPGHRRRRRHRPGRHPTPGRRGPGVEQPGPGRWPTAPPRCSSTWPPAPPWSPFVAWWALGDADDAVVRTVTVLVIACPHALGLAIPLVIASCRPRSAARNGILVKDRLALERHAHHRRRALRQDRHADQGRARRHRRRRAPTVTDDDDVLRLAGGGRGRQRAPAGPGHRRRGATSADGVARRHRLPVHHRPGRRGRRSTARAYAVGGPALLRERGAHGAGGARPTESTSGSSVAPPSSTSSEDDADHRGVRPRGRGPSRGPPRRRRPPRARRSQVVMITGDARQVADAVGAETSGVDEVFAEVLPEDKDRRSPSSRPGASRSPWSATASTTPPPSPGPTSASPSAPAPTSPSSPPASSWPSTTPAASSG